MACPSCHAPSDPDARYCESCGAQIDLACSGCGGSLSPSARFCRHCGAAASPEASAPDERRQITAMFCDLEGSTELSHHLELEDLRDVVMSYQAVCTRVVRKFGGHVAQYLGDGVLVYFGFPRSHENDAERAVRAALELQAELTAASRTRTARGGAQVLARVGIHSGVVVVSTLGRGVRRETLALGETINLAAHLQELAPPGGVVISRATRRLVKSELAADELRGSEFASLGPLLVREVLRSQESRVASPLGAAGVQILGRDAELAALLSCWERARAGSGQVTSISGDAGIGKTRLVAALRDRIDGEPDWIELSCSQYHTGSAYHPVIQQLERECGFASADEAEAKLRKLEKAVAGWPGVTPESSVPFLAKLLGLPQSPRFPLPPMSVDLQRERTLAAILAPLVSAQRERPLVVVVEDLHWCDRSTLELCDVLIARAPALAVLVIGTFRPSFSSRWARHGEHTQCLALARLSDDDTRALVALEAGEVRLPATLVEQMVTRANGVPLFAQALTQSVIEAGIVDDAVWRPGPSGRADLMRVPITLHGLLMAKLDRLGAAKQIAQVAAILDRDFSGALVAAVAGLDASTVAEELERLVAAGVLVRSETANGGTFTFAHVLVQETAYDSQLKRRRRELHARAANVLAQQFAGTAAAEPYVIARHFVEGGEPERAIAHYAEAGRLAIARLANAEAIDHFGTALDLLAVQPETPQRNQREALLRIAQSGSLAARGYDRPETIANQLRLEVLADAVGEGAARLPVLTGLAVFHQVRGDLPNARRWAEELLRTAEPLGVAPLCVAGHAIIGAAALTSARVPLACEHLAIADALAREAHLPPPATAFDIDTQALVSAVRSIALVLNGEPERALELQESGLRRAHELGHVYTLAHNISTASIVAYFLDDAERAVALARDSLTHSEGRGFHVPEAAARVFGGWGRTRLGDTAGLADVERGLAIALRSDSRGGLVQMHIAAAEAQLSAHHFERSAELIEQAAAIMAQTGERAAHEPQLLLLRAELIFASGSDTLECAQQLLLESIDGWHSFESRWMELRPALLLGEIALRTGGAAEAHARIRDLLGGFKADCETPRISRARRVLDSLAM